jgi:hypothetical protein
MGRGDRLHASRARCKHGLSETRAYRAIRPFVSCEEQACMVALEYGEDMRQNANSLFEAFRFDNI